MYLNFKEYQDMGGKLDEKDFESKVFEAGNYLNICTSSRLKKMKNIPLEVKKCVFKIISIIEDVTSSAPQDVEKNVSSYSNNGISISYKSDAFDNMTTSEKNEEILQEVYNTSFIYLYDLKYKGQSILYRGRI